MDISQLRHEYMRESLDEQDAERNPVAQFKKWFDEAAQAHIAFANAMTLTTVSAEGRPSARIVLLKDADEQGFVFYTNYESRKGREIAGNPRVALVFFWHELEREVRVEGRAETVTARESDAYFASRPLASRYAAIASPQSTVVRDRAELEAHYASVVKAHGETPPRPPSWGGYRVVPQSIEFWQGRPHRLHDRLLYTRSDERWLITRLAP
jgi:pyridoxamine 5'-phosphate oxidase